MLFNFDEQMIVDSISQVLDDAALQATEETFHNIVKEIYDTFPDVIDFIGQSVTEFWQSEAIDAGGWGSKYAKAIKYKIKKNVAEIYIDEETIDKGSEKPYAMFVEMMEKGVKSWSIKDELLKSEKAKVGKDGIKYITVPFPVRTPGRKGQGKMSSKFGGREMTNEMYRIVKSGGRLKSGTINVRGKDIDVTGLTRYETPQLHSQYGIFRRVSQNSEGWQYPMKAPQPVYAKVLDYVNQEIGKAITAYCAAILKEYSG